ncbi:hypothetical protein CYG49_02010 [Candidatus Saccharibacteria bacterium]|nr:MAG: hypothetical protein CYG49_02010 [Candidatus Saccharibacteria bacterium]
MINRFRQPVPDSLAGLETHSSAAAERWMLVDRQRGSTFGSFTFSEQSNLELPATPDEWSEFEQTVGARQFNVHQTRDEGLNVAKLWLSQHPERLAVPVIIAIKPERLDDGNHKQLISLLGITAFNALLSAGEAGSALGIPVVFTKKERRYQQRLFDRFKTSRPQAGEAISRTNNEA